MTFLRVQAFLERIDPALQIRKFRTPAFNKSSKTLESFPLFPFLSTERKGEGKFHDECGIRVIVEGGTKRFNVIFSGKLNGFVRGGITSKEFEISSSFFFEYSERNVFSLLTCI